VRIIGGVHRGRIVRFPALEALRPTPDRVRETLFNWLGQDLTGKRTLDLYSGSGALSLEAVSRGAALAVAVDRSPALIESLRTTAGTLAAAAIEAHVGDAQAFLRTERRPFDVIFADPPFREDPWPWLLPACLGRLAPRGHIYAESGAQVAASPGLVLWRRDTAGQVHYHLFTRSESAG
jgi:16S rRNA (guanine966-N2)-methyltransferase